MQSNWRNGAAGPRPGRAHRIRSGTQTIRVTVPREPARAGIDPYRKLIDRERHDNVFEVRPIPQRAADGRRALVEG